MTLLKLIFNDIRQIFIQYFNIIIFHEIIIAILIFILYFLIYKKLLKGKKNFKLYKFLVLMLLYAYLYIILNIAIFDRIIGSDTRLRLQPFASYKLGEWNYIIENILMFIPLGMLLPLLCDYFKSFFKITLCGLSITLYIEVSQFILKCGMMEVDDIIDNLLGTIVGYIIIRLFIYSNNYK